MLKFVVCWTLQLKLQLNFNQLPHMNGLMRNDFCIILYVCEFVSSFQTLTMTGSRLTQYSVVKGELCRVS